MMKSSVIRCKHGHTREEHPSCFRNEVSNAIDTNCKIGVFDIETLPMDVITWGMRDQYINNDQVLNDICFLAWSLKPLNEATFYSDILTPEEAVNRDARRITLSCWNILSTYDIIIGHNLSGFDKKMVNTFFLEYGLPPLKYIEIDTLVVARNNFRFSSNKLDAINSALGIKNKMEHGGIEVWKGCRVGDKAALSLMNSYNIKDVEITEDLYFKVRPYVRNINLALYNEIEEQQCPICGCKDLKNEGTYKTSAGVWDSLRCLNCGALSRGKFNHLTTEKKKSLLINS
jgi:DNA polymerase III alpha subunit (gram-positive type)